MRIPMIVTDDSGIVTDDSGIVTDVEWSETLPARQIVRLPDPGGLPAPPVLPGERQLWLADEGVFFVRAARSDSPLSTIRCACGSRRSSIASATAGSSIQACQ